MNHARSRTSVSRAKLGREASSQAGPWVGLSRGISVLGLAGLIVMAGCGRAPSSLFDGPEVTGPLPNTNPCPPQRTPNELKVKVNEVMVENVSVLKDDKGEYPPWVELYNNTDEPLDLGAVTLSDDFSALDKWRIPCVKAAVVPPRGFLVIYLDGDTEDELDLHASFTLQPGKSFQLIVNKGSDFFSFDGKKLAPDQSGGRSPDGGSKIDVLSEPTPGAPNSEHATPGGKEGTFIRGDANADGRVNVTDMSKILRVLFQGDPEPVCQDRLDSNDDGLAGVTDATYIGNALFLDGPSFPPPFPEEASDPTPDDLICPAPQGLEGLDSPEPLEG